jgi:hypothetical protein
MHPGLSAQVQKDDSDRKSFGFEPRETIVTICKKKSDIIARSFLILANAATHRIASLEK